MAGFGTQRNGAKDDEGSREYAGLETKSHRFVFPIIPGNPSHGNSRRQSAPSNRKPVI
jgi:hypothetical protein